MGFLRRRAVTAALTVNAIRPLGGYPGPLGSAFGWSTQDMIGWGLGWPVNETAPHVLAFTAVDTAVAVARGRTTRGSLALAAGTAAGLGYLISKSLAAGPLAERALEQSLGEDYLEKVPREVAEQPLRPKLREILNPFPLRWRGVEVLRNIDYRDGDRGGVLDIYRPTGVDLRDAPVLVWVHGGAWVMSDKRVEGQQLLAHMAQRGWVCVVPNYRFAPKHPMPAQIIDVKTAIAWTKEHVAEYGGDPSYVAISGGSAGGQLAAEAALTPNVRAYQPGFEDADTSVAACVAFYGVHDLAGLTDAPEVVRHRDEFLAPHVFRLDPEFRREVFELASPLANITPEAPDFFVLHGDVDTIVPVGQGRRFAARLREVSEGIVTYLEVPHGQHGFDGLNTLRGQQTARAAQRWLEWHRSNRRNRAVPAASVESKGTK